MTMKAANPRSPLVVSSMKVGGGMGVVPLPTSSMM